MKTLHGDLIELALNGEFDVIVHGCNCFNTMDGGIAKQIAKTFPKAYQADQATIPGDIWKLGSIGLVQATTNLIVVNAYTQFTHWETSPIEYGAIRDAFKSMSDDPRLNYHGNRIGIPKIGAGLAGGDWNRIEQIIESASPRLNISVIEYQP